MAFTYGWNNITAGMVDADSPGNETLFQGIRRNMIHLREWIGQSYYLNAASDHDHDGQNSKPVAGVGGRAVNRASIKSASGTVGGGAAANYLLPGGAWGFYPNVYQPALAYPSYKITAYIALNGGGVGAAGWTTPRCNIYLSTTVFAYQVYIQASPPYTLGGRLWRHFLFVLRQKSDGKVMGAYEAPDPPWGNNGPPSIPKDSPERIAITPHPFVDLMGKESSLDGDGMEIVLVDLSEMDAERWVNDCEKKGTSIIEELPFINGPRLDRKISGLPDAIAIRRGL